MTIENVWMGVIRCKIVLILFYQQISGDLLQQEHMSNQQIYLVTTAERAALGQNTVSNFQKTGSL